MFAVLFIVAFVADAHEWPPWSYGEDKTPLSIADAKQNRLFPPAQAVKWALKAFAATVSRVDGDRCAMMPSCSAYAIQAVEKHGFTVGLIMAFDRLMRCGGDEYRYASLMTARDGYSRIYDPLSHNDFWWYKTPDNLDK